MCAYICVFVADFGFTREFVIKSQTKIYILQIDIFTLNLFDKYK